MSLQVPDEDVINLVQQKVPSVTSLGVDLHLYDFKLSLPRHVNSRDMPVVCTLTQYHRRLGCFF